MSSFRLYTEWRYFDTDKETFINALRSLRLRYPPLYTKLAVCLGTKARRYFATRRIDLFPKSPWLAGAESNVGILEPGWYADANLSNRQKEQVLIMACVVSAIKYLNDFEIHFERGKYSPPARERVDENWKKITEELDTVIAFNRKQP